MSQFWIFILVLWVAQKKCNCDDNTFVNTVRFPFSQFYDPFMGLIVAMDLKLVPSKIDADFAWNIEANYFLPQNESEYTYPPIIPQDEERGMFDRTMLFRIIESKINSFSSSYGGKNCFLRLICEMTLYSTKDTDVLGDVIHILLSPSSSENEGLPVKYSNAEGYGLQNRHCKKYKKMCPLDIMNFFSVLGELMDNKFV